ncbi:MAG: type I DNA topoisomerase [Candidatus Magasanikbacteria bacterium]
MKLVIVESPTKAKTISKFLGKDFVVESSFGHVRDLPKSKMGIDIEGGTFEPSYMVSKDKTKHVTKLKQLAKKADAIIFATDEDREGEAISWHLAYLFDIKPEKAERIAFHEITKSAIEDALKHPRHIDQKLVDAQQARRVLDRLVGYELSPFLWKKVARGLSAGRVQSVAVRIIVEREREIQAFIPQEYWSLEGIFIPSSKKENQILGKLHTIDDKKIDRLEIKTKEQMDEILNDLKDETYHIKNIDEKETKRSPSAPFTTSTLQQQSNQKLGYSAKQTMVLAQQLYEGVELGSQGSIGLITYMRTDSVNLSDNFLNSASDYIKKNFSEKFLEKRTFKTKSKGAQEAHEAIRPTDVYNTPDAVAPYLNPQQLKLYTLIWKRSVATQMADARLLNTNIDINTQKSNNHAYSFRATGQRITFNGWLALYPETIKEETLPTLHIDETLVCEKLNPEQHSTEPPARYSDATLVKTLEEYGIGRPSTYAPTIATIEDRGYVERDDNKRLRPKDIAFLVNDLLVQHFSNIVDYQFTAQMEGNLDAIAEGEKDWKPIIATFYTPFHENVVQKTDNLTKEDTASMRELGADPESGKPIFVRIGRYGPFVQKGKAEDEEKPQFAKLKKEQSVETITLEDALILFTLPRILGTDEEGHDIIANTGRFGPYVQIEKKYFSIKGEDPYTITLQRAREIIAEQKEKKEKATIKKFENSTVEIRDGRYGPYITDTATKTNTKIPKDKAPADLTLEECTKLLIEQPSKKRWRKKK